MCVYIYIYVYVYIYIYIVCVYIYIYITIYIYILYIMIIMIIIIMPGGVAPGKAGHAKVIGGAIRREFDENSPTRGRTGGRKASNRIINIIPRGRFEEVSRTISRTLGL